METKTTMEIQGILYEHTKEDDYTLKELEIIRDTKWVRVDDVIKYLSFLEDEQIELTAMTKGTQYYSMSRVATDNQCLMLNRIRKALMYGDLANELSQSNPTDASLEVGSDKLSNLCLKDSPPLHHGRDSFIHKLKHDKFETECGLIIKNLNRLSNLDIFVSCPECLKFKKVK